MKNIPQASNFFSANPHLQDEGCGLASKKLDRLLYLDPGSCHIYHKPLLGYFINFKTNPSLETLKEYTQVLKNAGLSANDYNFPAKNGYERGIQFFNTIQETIELIDAKQKKVIASLITTMKNAGSPILQNSSSEPFFASLDTEVASERTVKLNQS